MNGGYFMVDCGGLVITSQVEQTIAGIYDRCKAAIDSGKVVIATNCVYNSSNATPFPVFAINEAGTLILTTSILQVRVTTGDKVNIVSLIES